MIKKFISAMILPAMLLLVDNVFAQAPPPPPPGLPIDGGIFVLAAAGIALALKKIKDR